MRFRHGNGDIIFLSYCSNVHPAEDVWGIIDQLERYAARVRRELEESCLGVGLWIPAPAASGLLRDRELLKRLKSSLERHSLEVVTLNGFPYGAFHAPVVKQNVYSPGWADSLREEYTLNLANILAHIMPEDVAGGSISSVPLGWRGGWSPARSTRAREALERVAAGLEELSVRTGRAVRLALEPEPGCKLETVEATAAFLKDLDCRWIGVCLDSCHLAVQFEDPAASLAVLREAGVPVVKAQLSSALRVPRPEDPGARDRLSRFSEPRFLHQVRERAAGEVLGVDDLYEALQGTLSGKGEWRVHFHVPIHHGGEETTQEELLKLLHALVGNGVPGTTHLEVETYTWSVLPGGHRPRGEEDLVKGIARELLWTRERLIGLGLEEVRL
jgi:hypothetical protein